MMISILGLGAMGARMAARLLDAGHTLTVWNRTPARAEGLASRGARLASSPRDASSGADLAISCVTDDEASRAVWFGDDGALAGLGAGAVAVESSTLTVAYVNELAEAVAATGAEFLDAPVAGSRPQAEGGHLVYLVGGDTRSLERARPALDVMGGAIHHVGPTGHGAAMKLAVNALFAVQVAAVAEWFATLRDAGLAEDRIVEVLSAVPVTSPAAAGALGAIARGAFDPLFPIDLVEKDLGYAVALASEAPATVAARETFARAQAEGFGGQNITAVARLFL